MVIVDNTDTCKNIISPTAIKKVFNGNLTLNYDGFYDGLGIKGKKEIDDLFSSSVRTQTRELCDFLAFWVFYKESHGEFISLEYDAFLYNQLTDIIYHRLHMLRQLWQYPKLILEPGNNCEKILRENDSVYMYLRLSSSVPGFFTISFVKNRFTKLDTEKKLILHHRFYIERKKSMNNFLDNFHIKFFHINLPHEYYVVLDTGSSPK